MPSNFAISSHQFYDKLDVSHYRGGGGNQEGEVEKIFAKMLRELTHEKPPRGRSGRHLEQDQHICVDLNRKPPERWNRNRGWTLRQRVVLASRELAEMEDRGTYPSYPRDNAGDIQSLLALHEKSQAKARVEHTVNGLQDLIQGLMGLGFKSAEYTEQDRNKYACTLEYDQFIITVEEK